MNTRSHPARRAHRVLAWLMVLVAPGTLPAADDPLESYRTARPLLDRAVESLGAEALGGLEAIDLRYSGTVVRRLQSPSPRPPFREDAVTGRFLYEPGGRTYEELETTFPGGVHLDFRRSYAGEAGWMHRIPEKELIELLPVNIRRLRSTAPESFMPHDLLRSARAHPASLRYAGRGTLNGKVVERVSFADGSGKTTTLSLDAGTGLPLAESSLGTGLLSGDTILTTLYAKYRQVGGLRIPHSLEFLSGGDTVLSWSLTGVRVNPDVDEAIFRRPEDLPLTRYTERWKPRKLAEGVHSVRLWNGAGFSWNILIVDLGESLAVMEAPLSDLLHPVVTAVAASVAPGKPIRYVIPTHHHQDHIAGLKAFMAAGTTVISTADGIETARRMAGTAPTLSPDPLGGAEPAGGYEVVGDTRVIRGPAREMRLYQVGPSPHVDQILIAHLPAEKILFVTDLFTAPESGVFGAPGEALVDFGRKLDELDLDVEIVVPGHGAVSTIQELRRALAGG